MSLHSDAEAGNKARPAGVGRRVLSIYGRFLDPIADRDCQIACCQNINCQITWKLFSVSERPVANWAN
jgi:hypothetical protein